MSREGGIHSLFDAGDPDTRIFVADGRDTVSFPVPTFERFDDDIAAVRWMRIRYPLDTVPADSLER